MSQVDKNLWKGVWKKVEEDWTIIGKGGKPFKLSLKEFLELVVAVPKGKPVQEVERKICRPKKVKLT